MPPERRPTLGRGRQSRGYTPEREEQGQPMPTPSQPDDPALHQLDPVGRFSDRAQDYVKYRPGYPAAAFDAIVAGLGASADLIAADVGAGTGISARLLADRGVRVIAIEPNREMPAA